TARGTSRAAWWRSTGERAAPTRRGPAARRSGDPVAPPGARHGRRAARGRAPAGGEPVRPRRVPRRGVAGSGGAGRGGARRAGSGTPRRRGPAVARPAGRREGRASRRRAAARPRPRDRRAKSRSRRPTRDLHFARDRRRCRAAVRRTQRVEREGRSHGVNPVQDPIVGAFAGLLARDPDAVCVRSVEQRATRRDVDALAQVVANRLQRAGLAPGATVALAAPNGPGFLGGLLGCLMARHPVVLLDDEVARREGPQAAESLGATALLTCAAWPSTRAPYVLRPLPNAVSRALPQGTTVLKMTSGSTGTPRAVAFDSQALMADCTQLARTMLIPPAD